MSKPITHCSHKLQTRIPLISRPSLLNCQKGVEFQRFRVTRENAPIERQPWTLSSIAEIASTNRYETWLLDQFGVLHDGKQAYPGAIDALENLANSGAQLILVSNSSKRSQVTVDKLPGLGFNPDLFSGIITSGELTHQNLLRRDDPWFASLGRKCVHFTWSTRGAISLEGLNLHVVEAIRDAEFILAHGTEALGLPDGSAISTPLADLERLLVEAASLPNPIPMIVANPDLVTVEARELRLMPGTLAKFYENLGGQVKWMGKPDPIIYKACFDLSKSSPSKIIAVGDSMHHDIQGAANAGFESVFVPGGIHASELHLKVHGQVPEEVTLNSFLSRFDANPNFIVPAFKW